MKGYICINDEKYDIEVNGMRDRSFGIRDWGFMHRWVIFWGELEDGRCFQVARVEYPAMRYVLKP